MAEPYRRFPNAALTVAKLLEPFAAPNRVGLRTPDNMTGLYPFIRVVRTGGPSDALNDRARLSIDVFDTDYTRGEALAERIRQHLARGRHRLGPAVIDRVVVDTAPADVGPWAPGVFRWLATYTTTSRRYTPAA